MEYSACLVSQRAWREKLADDTEKFARQHLPLSFKWWQVFIHEPSTAPSQVSKLQFSLSDECIGSKSVIGGKVLPLPVHRYYKQTPLWQVGSNPSSALWATSSFPPSWHRFNASHCISLLRTLARGLYSSSELLLLRVLKCQNLKGWVLA